jgi:hypothetical protein
MILENVNEKHQTTTKKHQKNVKKIKKVKHQKESKTSPFLYYTGTL